ncbi:hypothetical protein HJFPF1_12503 [Paramyrothecium foliicola]|nr:hypothetical protein HJFPF1_12503 [Paramyrothecium foliicola]
MADHQAPYCSWKLVSDNTWEQTYGFQDAFYGRILGKAGEQALFLVATSVKFRNTGQRSDEELAKAFRDAWIQMRYEYPIIAAISHEKKRTYQSPQSIAEVDTWASETFKVDETKTLPEIWRGLLKTRQPTLYFLPKTSELFMQGEHSHFDGRGLLHFWDEFFKLLVNPKPIQLGQELVNLPGQADDYVNTRERAPDRGRQLAAHLVESLEVPPPESSIAYPLKHLDDVAPQQPVLINSRATLKFLPEETLRINSACKSRNLSLTAVWHAAVVLATQDTQRDAGVLPGSTYVTFANFDIRRYFKGDAQKHSEGRAPIGNFHAVVPFIAKPNGQSFLDMARNLSSFYRLGLQEQPDIWSALRPMMQTMGDAFNSGPLTDTTPAISSLGVVDHYIKPKYEGSAGEFFIDDAWFGDTVTWPWIECFTWIWRGSLVLGSCFNGTFYSQEEVDLFHSKIAGHIFRGLGLTSATSKL